MIRSTGFQLALRISLGLAMSILAIMNTRFKQFLAGLACDLIDSICGRIRTSLTRVLTLRRYCRRQLKGTTSKLPVPSSKDFALDTDRVYVTLTLESYGTEQQLYNHKNLLSAGNRLRVVGDPGSGKSSLVKRLFRDQCHDAAAGAKRSRLPIILELKTLDIPSEIDDQVLGQWLYTHLQHHASEHKLYDMEHLFESAAATHGLLVLLDGLDEVSTDRYAKVAEASRQLSQLLERLGGENIVILTMRTQYHQQVRDDYRTDFPTVLFLRPFTPTDMFEFLSRWPFSTRARQNASRIYKELTDRPTLREMCSNPLVLSMYVAEDQASGAWAVPATRTDFYTRVTEELVIRRRQRQTGPEPARTLLKRQREQILGTLAREHLLDPSQPPNNLRWQDAIRVVRAVLNCSIDKAEAEFRAIASSTGLIREEQLGSTFRFIHLTFCEFLAAWETVNGQPNGFTDLIQAHKRFGAEGSGPLASRLAEVIPFACGLLPRKDKDEAIDLLWALGDLSLLARAFLETQHYEHRAWPPYLKRARSSLSSTSKDARDEQWMRDLHLFGVVVRDANECSNRAPTATQNVDLALFYKSLIKGSRQRMGHLLRAYARQDAVAALRLSEICEVDILHDFPDVIVDNCDQRVFFSIMQEQAMKDPEHLQEWASLFCEAALRSRAAALVLHECPLDDSLRQHITKSPRFMRAVCKLVMNGSLYSQYLRIALHCDQAYLIEKTPLLQFVLLTLPRAVAYWRISPTLCWFAVTPRVLALVPCVVGVAMCALGSLLLLTHKGPSAHDAWYCALIGLPVAALLLAAEAISNRARRRLEVVFNLYVDDALLADLVHSRLPSDSSEFVAFAFRLMTKVQRKSAMYISMSGLITLLVSARVDNSLIPRIQEHLPEVGSRVSGPKSRK